jgi:hypothetical protein
LTYLSILLALNGALVLMVCMAAGLLLYLSIVRDRSPNDWHLLHAGGTSRGIMLIALAATIHFADLPDWQSWWVAGLITLFVWTSVLAMLIRAVTGEPGFGFTGSGANKLVFALYAIGTVAVFAGVGWYVYGLLLAL